MDADMDQMMSKLKTLTIHYIENNQEKTKDDCEDYILQKLAQPEHQKIAKLLFDYVYDEASQEAIRLSSTSNYEIKETKETINLKFHSVKTQKNTKQGTQNVISKCKGIPNDFSRLLDDFSNLNSEKKEEIQKLKPKLKPELTQQLKPKLTQEEGEIAMTCLPPNIDFTSKTEKSSTLPHEVITMTYHHQSNGFLDLQHFTNLTYLAQKGIHYCNECIIYPNKIDELRLDDITTLLHFQNPAKKLITQSSARQQNDCKVETKIYEVPNVIEWIHTIQDFSIEISIKSILAPDLQKLKIQHAKKSCCAIFFIDAILNNNPTLKNLEWIEYDVNLRNFLIHRPGLGRYIEIFTFHMNCRATYEQMYDLIESLSIVFTHLKYINVYWKNANYDLLKKTMDKFFPNVARVTIV